MRRTKSVFGVFLMSLASTSAFAAGNLEEKIRCDYVVTDYDETHAVTLPSGDDEHVVTAIRDNKIGLNVRIFASSFAENPEVFSIRAVRYDIAKGRLHSLESINAELTGFEKAVLRETGSDSNGNRFNNLISCRRLTKEESEKVVSDKEQARKEVEKETEDAPPASEEPSSQEEQGEQ